MPAQAGAGSAGTGMAAKLGAVMTEFIARLKQRKLVQWAVAYVAFAFALIQVLDVVSDSYGWPRAAMHVVFGLLVLGFVVTVILAWYHGERGAQRISGPELLLIALALVIGGGLIWHFARAPTMNATAPPIASASSSGANSGAAVPAAARTALAAANNTPTANAAFDPPADSIVVLPFANLGGDKSQQYFSDGITEELTSALGQNTGLTVIAWETASHYRGGVDTPAEIGKALDVAHILDGSIQRAGDEVRVSAELVSTVTGRQLWSAHYDATLKNIFAVQDKITGSIAGALKVKFAGMRAAPTQSPAAHELYLKGLAAVHNLTAVGGQTAKTYFQQALKLDPNYADAWAALAQTYSMLSEFSTLPLQEALPKIRAAAGKALQLDPHNVRALVALGTADAIDNQPAKAKAEYRQALALDPSNALAHELYGLLLPPKESLAQEREAGMLDPKDTGAWNNLAVGDLDLGDWPQVLTAARTMIRLTPQNIDAAIYLAFAYTEMQRGEDAVKAFDRVKPATAPDQQLVDAGRLTYQTLLNPVLRPKALMALDELRRSKLSPDNRLNLMQFYLALGKTEPVLQMLPTTCASSPLTCGNLATIPIFAPLHGDPRFEKLAKQYTAEAPDAAPASAASR